MNNTTIIIFGATGDLAKRKLFPALYRYVEKNRLESLLIIGVAIDDVTSNQMVQAARPFIPHVKDDDWDILQHNSYYKKINFTEYDNFIELKAFVDDCEKKHNKTTSNRLFYLATGAQFFCPITESLVRAGILQRKTEKEHECHRIVYEKPFGHDGLSAHTINECIQRSLDESQVYRIDHYLTKEIVSNIAMIRFTNAVFEPLWSHNYVDHVQIILSESMGIEQRGAYYDAFGAIRDVVQNHMLELLALMCMEIPEKFKGECIRAERAKVLERVRFADGITGQYSTYTDEHGVNPASKTETFAALQLFVDNPRWRDVPFYLKTGKYLGKKETVIHIKFKTVDCLLVQGCPLDANWLTIKIAPEAVFLLTLNVKQPNVTDQVVPVNMEFCHSCIFGVQTPQAYEVLLAEVMRGEQSIAVRVDEIEYAWKIIDTIMAQKLPLYTYQKGSAGPQEAEKFAQKHGMRWRS